MFTYFMYHPLRPSSGLSSGESSLVLSFLCGGDSDLHEAGIAVCKNEARIGDSIFLAFLGILNQSNTVVKVLYATLFLLWSNESESNGQTL